MNLAFKDIRFNFARFMLTVAGIGFLIAASIGMVGLYRGIIADALLVIDKIGTDLWVVQGQRQGPFSESSSVPASLDERVRSIPNTTNVRRYVQFSYQFEHNGRQRRAAISGLDYPTDKGGWLDLVYGRNLNAGHHEAIADLGVGLALGEHIVLGHDTFRIVGLTKGMVDMSGDAMIFISLNDAITLAATRTPEEVLLTRARAANAKTSGTGAGDDSASRHVGAVLVSVPSAADMEKVRAALMRWGDVNVLSTKEQHDLLLNQRLWRLRVQILAFTAVLLAVMALVISVIVYTMTIEKLHQIAMLKLIGARNSLIISMIVQQAALIGIGGFGLGLILANLIFPYFPRRIVIEPADLAMLFAAVAAISGLASLFGISRALRVRAQEVLS